MDVILTSDSKEKILFGAENEVEHLFVPESKGSTYEKKITPLSLIAVFAC